MKNTVCLPVFFREEILPLNECLPQRHEVDLQAIWKFILEHAEILHHVRGIVREIVVNLLECQFA